MNEHFSLNPEFEETISKKLDITVFFLKHRDNVVKLAV